MQLLCNYRNWSPESSYKSGTRIPRQLYVETKTRRGGGLGGGGISLIPSPLIMSGLGMRPSGVSRQLAPDRYLACNGIHTVHGVAVFDVFFSQRSEASSILCKVRWRGWEEPCSLCN